MYVYDVCVGDVCVCVHLQGAFMMCVWCGCVRL